MGWFHELSLFRYYCSAIVMPNLTIKILNTFRLLVKTPYINNDNLKRLNATGS